MARPAEYTSTAARIRFSVARLSGGERGAVRQPDQTDPVAVELRAAFGGIDNSAKLVANPSIAFEYEPGALRDRHRVVVVVPFMRAGKDRPDESASGAGYEVELVGLEVD